MLELLVVHPEQEGGDDPIGGTVGSPVLHRDHGQSFSEVTLESDPVQKGWVIGSRISRRIIEWRQIILEATPQAASRVFEGLVNISCEFCSESG